MSIRTDPRVGTELAGYRIEALLGRGGMADVYRAVDLRLGRKVALKLLAPHLADDERFRERFLRESQLAASLDHPNVVPIYEAGEVEGLLYIAMRHVEGTDLRRVLDRERTLDPRRALFLLARVADALDTAHAHGLVHRDVKPANVLIAVDSNADPPEHPYLSDFGLTREGTEPGLTESGRFLGTADYAAPELVTRGPVDARTDEYALGCVLFECLTGEPPFRGDSLLAVLFAQVNDPPPAASERNAALPRGIDAVLRKALAKAPGRRYGSCRELLAAARDALAPSAELPQLAAAPKPVYRRREVLLGAGAALVAAAVVPSVLLTRGGRPKPVLGPLSTLAWIDASTGKLLAFDAGPTPSGVAVGERAAWVGNGEQGTVSRVDLKTGAVTEIPLGSSPVSLAAHRGAIAIVGYPSPPQVTAIDEASRQVIGTIPLDLSPPYGYLAPPQLAAGDQGVWLLSFDESTLRRLDLADGGPALGAPVPLSMSADPAKPTAVATGLAVGEGAVWVVGHLQDRFLLELDPATGRRAGLVELEFPPSRIAAGEGALWVTDRLDGNLWRVDPTTFEAAAIPVGRSPSGVAAGLGWVWVANAGDGTVSKVDPAARRVVDTIELGPGVADVAVGAGGVWVTLDAA